MADATGLEEEDVFEKLTRREYALIACAAGGLSLGLLPLLLHAFGTRWRPGKRHGHRKTGTTAEPQPVAVGRA